MNYLEQVEGLRGENLTSSILRYLLLRSQVIRETFTELISARSYHGPIGIASHFSCYLEDPSQDEYDNRGRIDIVLETDQAVIGVENKIHADFGNDQPHKYINSIKEKSERMASLRCIKKCMYFILILAPKYRDNAIKKITDSDDHLIYISWEELLETIQETITQKSTEIDQKTHIAFEDLNDYMSNKIDFLPNFEKYCSYIKEQFIPGGTEYQNRLVDKLAEFFPNITRRGTGKLHYGYGFYDGNGWYGITKGSTLGLDDESSANLIILTRKRDIKFSSSFKEIEIPSNWEPWGYNKCWIVDFENTWNNAEKWRDELAPLENWE